MVVKWGSFTAPTSKMVLVSTVILVKPNLLCSDGFSLQHTGALDQLTALGSQGRETGASDTCPKSLFTRA